MIRVELVTGEGIEVLNSARDEWSRLYPASERNPFQSWNWTYAWFNAFGNRRSPALINVYDGNQLIGILPMFQEAQRILVSKLSRIALLSDRIGGADHLGPICREEDAASVVQAALEFLVSRTESDIIDFGHIDADAELANVVSPDDRFTARKTKVSVCPQIDLRCGWDSVLNSSKRSQNFKRRLKKLRAENGFEFRSIDSPNELSAAFERFLVLHEQRWQKSGGSELSGHPKLVDFQRSVVSTLANDGLLRFDELWFDGECRGSIYGFDNGSTFYFYNTGYDIRFPQFSIGLVLLGLSIQNACERGIATYDLLRGDETYKSDWANRRIEQVDLRLSRQRPMLQLHDLLSNGGVRLKELGKAMVPNGILEPIAGLRRSLGRRHQLSDQ